MRYLGLIQCKKCNYRKMFTLGIGFMDSSIENILDSTIRSRQSRECIKRILKDETVNNIDYSRVIMRCERCNRLYARLSLKIEHQSGTYIQLYRCPKCKGQLNELPECKNNTKEVPCPDCGKPALVIEDCGFWD